MHLKLLETLGPEPVTLPLAKKHLRLNEDATSEDALLNVYCKAARKAAEHYINQAIVRARYEQSADYFNPHFRLLAHPVLEVETVAWGDYAYTTEEINIRGNEVYLPSIQQERKFNSAKVTYTAGMEEVPEDILSAMLLILGNLYENRESVVIGQTPSELPMGARFLLDPYRLLRV